MYAHARTLLPGRGGSPGPGRVDRPADPAGADRSGPLRARSFLSDARVANRTAARSSRRRVRAASRAVTRPAKVAELDQMTRRTNI